jgi:hypothetical protein
MSIASAVYSGDPSRFIVVFRSREIAFHGAKGDKSIVEKAAIFSGIIFDTQSSSIG